jgi:hypothetical protein
MSKQYLSKYHILEVTLHAHLKIYYAFYFKMLHWRSGYQLGANVNAYCCHGMDKPSWHEHVVSLELLKAIVSLENIGKALNMHFHNTIIVV